MKKLTYIFVFFITLLQACTSKSELPEGILNEEQMINVIVDLEINQAMYKLKFANKDSVDFNQLVDYSFAQQNTTKEQFNNSLAYYGKYPKQMEAFYEKAIVILSKKQAGIKLNVAK